MCLNPTFAPDLNNAIKHGHSDSRLIAGRVVAYCEGSTLSNKSIEQEPLRTVVEASLGFSLEQEHNPHQLESLLQELQRQQSELHRQNEALQQAHLAMEKLRERDKLNNLFVEYAPASLAMLDRDMNYLVVSKRWREDYSIKCPDIIGVSHYQVFPENQQVWKTRHLRALSGEVMRGNEDRFERPDGSVQWLSWEIRPWYASDASIGGIIISTEDISKHKHLEAALVAVDEKRQCSIGQELHDNVGQQIAAIGYQAKALEKILFASGNREAATSVASIASQAQQAVVQCKQLAQGLLPFEIEGNGLVAALHILASRISSAYSIVCDFICENDVLITDMNLALNYYRIAQEAVHNAIHHGHAQQVSLFLESAGGNLRLVISDDGCGLIAAPAKRSTSSGMGIKIMHYRARQCRAKLKMSSRAQGGTEVSVEMRAD